MSHMDKRPCSVYLNKNGIAAEEVKTAYGDEDEEEDIVPQEKRNIGMVAASYNEHQQNGQV